MFERLLVANRGEIAIRIIRTADDLGIDTVAIAPEDDASTRHMTLATTSAMIPGSGPAAYLDIEAVVAAGVAAGCDAVHPGYGFLAENADFADACEAAGLVFVGPTPATLRALGDKRSGLDLAKSLGVTVAESTGLLGDAGELSDFMGRVGPVMLKAAAGGGGRGMRIVHPGDDLTSAIERCRSEATSAFGDGSIFAEQLIPTAKHIEVQVIGDGTGAVSHIWDRDCSLQRQRQKVIEFAPVTAIDSGRREAILADAVRMAAALDYRGLATFEFLVTDSAHVFIEANPRIQVEHTVTEAITGIDLVGAQLGIAAGSTLADLGLASPPPISGIAVQLRVNAERMASDGSILPVAGCIERFEQPGGTGIRVDSHATRGFEVSPRYDSLLAKVIVHAADADMLLRRARRALDELVVDGVHTNVGVLRRLLANGKVASLDLHTTLIGELAAEIADGEPERTESRQHGGDTAIVAPLLGTIVSLAVSTGDVVHAGDELLVLEAMKMEHVVVAPSGGQITSVDVAPGEAVGAGTAMLGFASDGSTSKRPGTRSRSTSTASGPTSPNRSSDTASVSTSADRSGWSGDTAPANGRPARTWPTWSTMGRSSSTDRS